MEIKAHLGLDISKNKIDCCLLINNESINFIIDNNLNGFNNLLIQFSKYKIELKTLHVCSEATNVYYLPVSKFLFENGALVSVVNPSIIKSYAEFKLKRIKTDKQDAKIIAEFCEKENPEKWQPESVEQVKLKSLHRRIEQLLEMQIMEKNRLSVADSVALHSINQMIDFLSKQIELCRQEMQDLINKSEQLMRKQKILQSIVGIGRTTAQILLTVMIDIDKFSTARHLVSWLGLSPVIRESGNRKGKSTISKMGNRAIRKALYMPARAACTRSKLWRSWFEAHLARGKHPKQVYVLMMVKLVKYAYTCLKNNTYFDVKRHQDVGAEEMGV